MMAYKILGYLILITPSILFSKSVELNCGVAIGYPPYQYTENSEAKGIDPDKIREFNLHNKGKVHINIKSLNWDDAVAYLYYTEKLDCIWGMEINEERKKRFLFSKPIYHRYSSLFVLKNSSIHSIDDLKNKTITGDANSLIEESIKKIPEIRIISTKTKDEAFQKLKDNKVQGSIFPKKVGHYLSEKYKTDVRIISDSQKGTPVGVATKKQYILDIITKGLESIPQK